MTLLFFKFAFAFILMDLIVDLRQINGNLIQWTRRCAQSHNPRMCEEASFFKDLMDDQVDPCDNFYQFACGHAFENYPISDSDTVGVFSGMQSNINYQILSAIQEIDTSYPKSLRLMQIYYQQCIKEEEDMNSISMILKNIGGFPLLLGDNWNETAYDWIEALYKIIDEDIFIEFPVIIGIFNGQLNDSKNIPMVFSARTDLKNDFKDIERNYNQTVEIVKILGGQNISGEDVQELINFEIQLSNITSQTSDKKLMSIKSLSEKYPSIPWLELFNKILNSHNVSIDSSDVVMLKDEQFICELEKLINSTSKKTIANYITLQVFRSLYSYLPKQFDQFKQKYKLNKFPTREFFCLQELKEQFAIALGALYVEKYVTPSFDEVTYKDIETVVKNVKKQIERDIKKATWMDDNTRKAALKKIHNMHDWIGHSKELADTSKVDEYYNNLELSTESFLRSSITLSAFNLGKQYQNFNRPLVKRSWLTRMSNVRFNAEYKYFENAIDIPAAFLQGVMYKYNRPKYLNYGALGSIIGHEITHGFDNEGRNYDENGNLRNWWSNSTEKKYMEKAQCLIDQFSNFSMPNLNITVNGVQTQNEVIADNGGFKAAYNAYNDWVERSGIVEAPLPYLKYTAKQMFWITSAANWCSKDGSQFLRNSIDTDTHPPHLPRVILSFSNIKEFSDDFKCGVGSRMNPVKKCDLW